MAILQPQEYDASYFDGETQQTRHNAGYSSYKRIHSGRGANSLGEYWKDYAAKLKNTRSLAGKKVLEIGCAKGFIVKDLRDMGVDAWGIDVSQYAVDNAEVEAKPFLIVGDARTALAQFSNNQFDAVFSLRFLECIPEADLPGLVSELNRISRFQFHVVDQFTGEKQAAGQYYLQKTLAEWKALSWSKGTVLIAQENEQNFVTK